MTSGVARMELADLGEVGEPHVCELTRQLLQAVFQIRRHRLLAIAADVLKGLLEFEEFYWFSSPVPDDTPGYTEIISAPQDYLTIYNRLSGSENMTASRFLADMETLFANCAEYNAESRFEGHPHEIIFAAGEQQNATFRRLVAEAGLAEAISQDEEQQEEDEKFYVSCAPNVPCCMLDAEEREIWQARLNELNDIIKAPLAPLPQLFKQAGKRKREYVDTDEDEDFDPQPELEARAPPKRAVAATAATGLCGTCKRAQPCRNKTTGAVNSQCAACLCKTYFANMKTAITNAPRFLSYAEFTERMKFFTDLIASEGEALKAAEAAAGLAK